MTSNKSELIIFVAILGAYLKNYLMIKKLINQLEYKHKNFKHIKLIKPTRFIGIRFNVYSYFCISY